MDKWILTGVFFSWAVFGMFSPSAQGFVNKGGGETTQTLTVLNSRGERLGTVKEAVLDERGNIVFVVLSLEDETGEKTKRVLVPTTSFSKGSDGKVILDMERQVLAAGPEIDSGQLNDPAFLEKIFRYYGQTPPWAEYKK